MKSVKYPGPSHGHGRGAEEVFENQIPANDPGDELAQGGIRIRVRAPRDRDHRRELGVAQPREQTGEPGRDEGQHDGGARIGGGGLPSQHEDTGADDGPDAEHDQVRGGEHAVQPFLARFPRVGLGLQHRDALNRS